MKHIGVFSLFIILILSACRKDINEETTVVTTPNPEIENYNPKEELIVGDLIGFIVDEDNNPIANVLVEVEGENTTTDQYGHFFMEDKTMNAFGTLAKVEKEGFFKGSRRFFPNAGQKNRLKIELIRKTFDDTFNAETGGTVTTVEGASIEFYPGSLRTESGIIYSGMVEVSTKWMNPTYTETLDQIPGNLQGLNRNIEERALSMFGALAIEIQGINGEPLYLIEDKPSTLKMPIPTLLQGQAPNEISLWSYNELHGLWVEQTLATKQDGFYSGEIHDISTWSLNTSVEFINLGLRFINSEGFPLVNYQISMAYTSNDGFSFSYTYTDDSGQATMLAPKNESFYLNLSVNCGSLFSEEMGPYNVNSMEIITVDDPFVGVNATRLTGRLVDCNNEAVTNGMINVEFNEYTIYQYADENGLFDISFTSCDNPDEVTITGINIDLQEKGLAIIVTANQTTFLGDLSTCGNTFDNFLTVTIDGESKTYEDAFADTSSPNSTWIQIPYVNGGAWLSFIFEGETVGDYSNSTKNVFDWPIDPEIGWDFGQVFGHMTTFNVSQYDTQLVGTASGFMEGAGTGGTDIPINISFNLAL